MLVAAPCCKCVAYSLSRPTRLRKDRRQGCTLLTATISFSLRQSPHHSLKSHQRHCIRRKRPQKARHETSPVASPPCLPIHRLRCISPSREPAVSPKRVRHDSLFDNVARIRGDPEDLCGETASPEVDGGSGEAGVVLEGAGEDVVGAPPETEESSEEEGRAEAVVDAADAVVLELHGLVRGEW